MTRPVKKRFRWSGKLENNPTWLCVVALALLREDGRVLMHRRPEGKHHAGLWEFPGGKVEPGETPANALVREIREELGIFIATEALTPAGFAQEPANNVHAPIVILLYTCSTWVGDPQALEGGAIEWVPLAELAALDKPPLDVALAAGLVARKAD